MPVKVRRKRPRTRRGKRAAKSRVGKTLSSSRTLTVVRNASVIKAEHTIVAATQDSYFSYAMPFSLDKMINYSEFIPCFDQYKINWVTVQFLFAGNWLPMSDTYFAFMPYRLATAIDYDDATYPAASQAGWEAIQERKGCKTQIVLGANCKNTLTRKIVPRVLSMVYNDQTSTAYGPAKPRTYFDCSSPAIPHYGLKWVLYCPKQSTSGSHDMGLRYDIQVRYSVTFTGMH